MTHLPSGRYMAFMGLFVLVLVLSGSWLLLRANGYTVLWEPFRLVKSGVISLRVHPSTDIAITINSVPQRAGQRDFPDLVPGRYTVRVEREEFSPWEKTVQIVGGDALRYEDVVLFYAEPAHRVVTESERSVFEKVLASRADFRSGLQIFDNEIWNEDELVTRYSATVTDALWLPGRTHVLALVDNELHVLEKDGGQDLILATPAGLASDIQFAPISGGSELIVLADGQMEIYAITESKILLRLPTFQRTTSPVE